MAIKNARMPPGPAENYDTARALLGWLKQHFDQYGDIYKARVYGADVYVISSPDYAEHVLLKNWQNYWRKGQAVKRIALSLGNGLISSNGDFWIKQRRMIQPAFTRAAVRAQLNVLIEPNIALRARWGKAAQAAATVDVTRDVSQTVLEITLRSIFGDDYGTVAPHFALIAEGSRDLEFAQRCSALGQMIGQIAARRRHDRIDAHDILGAIMRTRTRDAGLAMPDAQLAREALTLVIAGHETTASVLNWTWYLLSKHLEVEARLSDEISNFARNDSPVWQDLGRFTYARQIIEEALRSYPPLWLMTRKALQADWLGEYFVPAGTEIYISPYLIQRHPNLWVDPDRFDPDRFGAGEASARHPLATCPFGAGPRNCIGEFFARVEMQVHLLTVAKELRLRYADTKPVEIVAGVNLLSRHHFIMQPEIKNAAFAARLSAGTYDSLPEPHGA